MPARSSWQPRPVPLPFDDTETRPRVPRAESAAPTAFITYSHETPEHQQRVLDLAQQLRSDGVDCCVDAFEVNPSEGWPAWMWKGVQTPDFCIAVCTETFARRLEGQELPGKGKGAVWEGRALLQRLYDSGKSDFLVPVVFDRADLKHIPPVLQAATHYVLGADLATDEGYTRLHRALTNQPLDTRSPVGPLRRRLPRLDSNESKIVALLNLCQDPVPRDVVARAIGPATADVSQFSRLVTTEIVKIDDDLAHLADRAVYGLPGISDDVAGKALGAVLDFIEYSRGSRARGQMMNAVALAQTVDVRSALADVSRTFRILQSLLKSSGNKRLVLDVARASVAASRLVDQRDPEQVEDDAIATICGVSWVYQRTGRLAEALAEAQTSSPWK